MIPNELTGRKLVLVNEKGKPYGRIDMGPEGGEIKLYDPSGKNIWQAPFHFGVTPTDSGAKPH
jgi:hypothetical protein